MSNMDQSVLYYQAQEPGVIDEQSKGPGPFDQLVHAETIPPERFKEPPFKFDNAEAFGVNQRSAKRWTGSTAEVGSTPISLIPSQKGRKTVILAVPSTSAAGVYVDSTDATLENSLGFLIPIGGSLSIDTEDSIYAKSATAGTATLVSFIVTWG